MLIAWDFDFIFVRETKVHPPKVGKVGVLLYSGCIPVQPSEKSNVQVTLMLQLLHLVYLDHHLMNTKTLSRAIEYSGDASRQLINNWIAGIRQHQHLPPKVGTSYPLPKFDSRHALRNNIIQLFQGAIHSIQLIDD